MLYEFYWFTIFHFRKGTYINGISQIGKGLFISGAEGVLLLAAFDEINI